MKKKICVFTGKRGGFGALVPTMALLDQDPQFELQVVVSDQHLYDEFGRTIDEVQAHFNVSAKLEMNQQGDSPRDRTEALGRCLAQAAKAFDNLRPDLLLVFGDRGEVLSASIAAHNMGIAIGHIQGGDVSGSLDEPMRHAITKLAHLHFPATQKSMERILQMGEEPWRVHLVGDLHVDPIFLSSSGDKTNVLSRYNINSEEPYLIVLQHPDSQMPHASSSQMKITLEAVLSFGLRTLLIYPCTDQGYKGIIQEIESKRAYPGVSIHPNIGAADFLILEKHAACLIGNSSSGLIEAPYFGLSSVNIGDRQIGRERCINVIDVPHERFAIQRAIEKALHDKSFRDACQHIQPLFGDGTAYQKIHSVLASVEINSHLLNKRWCAYEAQSALL